MLMRAEDKKKEEEKRYCRQLIGKTVVTKSGKRFGEVANITFETRTGELMHVILKNPTVYAESLELEKDQNGNTLIPFNSVLAIGDFIVVSEDDII